MSIKAWLPVAAVGLALTLSACAGPNKEMTASSGLTSPQAPGEKLLWSSAPGRPNWTMSEPETEKGFQYFVGLSGDYATENLARDDALRNATTRVVQYMGALAKDKFERARTSFGLASTVVDPTEAARQFEKQLSANVARQLKPKEWYIEQWQKPTGFGYKAFVLARMPTESVNESLKNTAEDNVRKAQEDAKKAATETAKKQAEDAADFWKKMKEQGLVE
jgi:hypothetical protein